MIEDNRGVLQFPQTYLDLPTWKKIRYGNATGTDIDYFLELGDKIFIVIEYKRHENEIPGQALALLRLVDALIDAGKHSLLINALQNANDIGDFKVLRYRSRKTWYFPEKEKTCKQICDDFVNRFYSERGTIVL